MNVFVITTAIIMMLFSIGQKPVDYVAIGTQKAKIRETSTVFFVIGAIFFAYVVGQRYGYGDTFAYIDTFYRTNETIAESLSKFQLGEEWLFKFYIVVVKNLITKEAEMFIEITAFLTIIPIMYFYYNYSGDLKFAFYLFVTTGCWDHTMNGLRQYLACSLLLIGLPLLYKKRWYLYLPLVVAVAQIHTSAYIFLAIYFIANMPAFGKFTKMILIFSILLALSTPITGNYIQKLFFENSEYGERYGNSDWDYGINIFRVLVFSVPMVLAYINRGKMRDKYKYYDIVFNMSLLAFITTLLGMISAVYARLNLYFELFNVVILVWNINEMNREEKYKWIKPAAYCMYTLYFIYQMVFTYSMQWHQPGLFRFY